MNCRKLKERNKDKALIVGLAILIALHTKLLLIVPKPHAASISSRHLKIYNFSPKDRNAKIVPEDEDEDEV